jgi:metal-sulfur cluster biosynthetic enzyme
MGPSQQSAAEYVLDEPGLNPTEATVDAEALRDAAICTLRTIKDPEIPLNIYDLGLIYSLDTDANGRVVVAMSLTSPGCPVAGVLVKQVHDNLRRLNGASTVRTQLIWDPPWSKDRLSEAARLALDLL